MVLVITDFFLCNIQFQVSHWWPILVASLAYLLINLIVTLADKPVYDVLTYKDALSYIYVLVTIGLAIGSFFLFYGFSVCKRKVLISGYAQAKKTDRVWATNSKSFNINIICIVI